MKRVYLLILILSLFLSSCTVKYLGRQPLETSVYEIPTVAPQGRHALYHSVAPGETIWRIAKMYGVDVEAIKKANYIRDVTDLDIGTNLYIPGAEPRKHVLTFYPNTNWKYIVIHHSATGYGSSTQFNKAHISKGWSGVGYHFIIDNGTCGKGDGQIEISPRWIKQVPGAHCRAGNMNEIGIGICLVGNFSREKVSPKQMRSLVYLVNKLRKFYKIPAANIIGHGQVKGARTECPGRHFPWGEFKSNLWR